MSVNFPMSIRELADELEQLGVDMIVYRTKVEYDEYVVGAGVYATLECRVDDKRPIGDHEDSYERAMKILQGR